MKVVAISGSLGESSSNALLLRRLASSAGPDLDVAFADELGDLPPFRPDIDAPPIVLRWRRRLADADAIVIASPEYGHSLPGALKNGIDWVIGSGELYGKRVAITAAVRTLDRGRRGLRALADTLRAVDATVVWDRPIVGDATESATIAELWQRLRGAPPTPAVLYDYPISGNGWKVRTLLRRLEIPFRIQWLDLLTGENHAPWFRAKNPAAQVPVLDLPDGRCLRESSTILAMVAEGTPLFPDGDARADILAWMAFEQTFIEGIVSRAIFRRLHPEVIETPEAFFAAWTAEGTRGLQILDAHLQARDFMVGGALTIADIALYAYTHRAELADFDLQPLPALRRWHARVRDEPGVLAFDLNPEAT